MSSEDKADFFRDGYLVIRDVVPRKTVAAARRAITNQFRSAWGQTLQLGRQAIQDGKLSTASVENLANSAKAVMRLGARDEFLSTVSLESELMQLIVSAMGCAPRGVRGSQLAIVWPSEPGDRISESGYRERDIPFFGWQGHLDGLWNGAAGVHQDTSRDMTEEEFERWNRPQARNGIRKTYDEVNTSVANFTCLVGIPLSDQMHEGCGNLGLLRGAHHEIETFFTKQRELGGRLGPDGPNWDRIHTEAPNGYGLRHYPEQVRDAFSEGAAQTDDGRNWPRPTFIRVKPGDAVLFLHAVPHSASRNESDEPRLMLYFRLTSSLRPKQFHTSYPDALCDAWLEWPGMHDTVSALRPAS